VTTANPSRVQIWNAITTAVMPNTVRTASGLTPMYSARPPATPATTLSEARRRRGRRPAGSAGTASGVATLSAVSIGTR